MEILNKDQAWQDFAQNVKPGIWESLTYAERNAIQQAEKDFRNERVDIRGKPVNLAWIELKEFWSNTPLSDTKYKFGSSAG